MFPLGDPIGLPFFSEQDMIRQLHIGLSCVPGLDYDIIDEALYFFKANIFFKNYEVKVSTTICAGDYRLSSVVLEYCILPLIIRV